MAISTTPRRFGIQPASADQQLQKFHTFQRNQKFEPLPKPTGAYPYRMSSTDAGIAPANGRRVLHVTGDTGGVVEARYQLNVTEAMIGDAARADEGATPSCFYHLGDVVYFLGAENEYGQQFYEPYAHYNLPIVAIPGNHDGEIEQDGSAQSLAGFVQNFCASAPHLDPEAQETNRDTMTQPNVYWTLVDDLVTIVGMYTNVPEGGQVDQDQVEWLVAELREARADRKLLLALHHPPYSVDAHHGGSTRMGQLLDEAFERSGRAPDMVLSGHVHNYQRFTRTLNGKQIPYIVAGAGGYHNLHKLAKSKDGEQVAVPMPFTEDCTLESFCDDQWGFLRLAITQAGISGEYVAVDRSGSVTPGFDRFQV